MKRILIIDDDVTALDIVDYLFEDKGFDVVRRADGQSALETIDENVPDIILIDLMMPRMNGQECVRQLRQKGILVPIVAFTALNHIGSVVEANDMVVSGSPCEDHCDELISAPDGAVRKSNLKAQVLDCVGWRERGDGNRPAIDKSHSQIE